MEPLILQSDSMPWQPHPRFQGVFTKVVISSQANPVLSLHLVKIEPHGAIPPHTHPDSAETFMAISGKGICTMGNLKIAFGPGDCALAPAGVEHGLQNIGDEPMVLLAIFTPPLV